MNGSGDGRTATNQPPCPSGHESIFVDKAVVEPDDDVLGIRQLAQRVLSVRCEPVSTGWIGILKRRGSGHEGLPLSPGGGAAVFESLAVDEVAFGIEVIV